MRTMGPFLRPASTPQMASSTCPFFPSCSRGGGKGAPHTFSVLLLKLWHLKTTQNKLRRIRNMTQVVEVCASLSRTLLCNLWTQWKQQKQWFSAKLTFLCLQKKQKQNKDNVKQSELESFYRCKSKFRAGVCTSNQLLFNESAAK